MKKLWKTVEIKEFENNTFQLLLDKNFLKTPLQNKLIFLNYDSAYETSLEWDVDEDILNTDDMISYGIYSTAIDRISNDRQLFINEITEFIDTDMICYRADKPVELCQLQNLKWDPILLTIKGYIDIKIGVFQGIIPKKQNTQVHKKIKKIINQFSDLEISILYRLTHITGSIFISLSLLKGDFLKKNLFETCFLDEIWQAEQWGQEEESTLKRERIYKELNKLVTLIGLTKY
jgi:chaperone required for assembly of F1-ATPase